MILLSRIEIFEGEESSNDWSSVNGMFGEPGYDRFSYLFFLVVLVKDGSCITLSSVVELAFAIRRIDVVKKNIPQAVYSSRPADYSVPRRFRDDRWFRCLPLHRWGVRHGHQHTQR